jgi:hypothetical protein
MEQNRQRITDRSSHQSHWGQGASLLARFWDNTLPNLTRLSLLNAGIGDDGYIALVSAPRDIPLVAILMCAAQMARIQVNSYPSEP